MTARLLALPGAPLLLTTCCLNFCAAVVLAAAISARHAVWLEAR